MVQDVKRRSDGRLVRLTGIPFVWGGNNPETGMDCFTYASYLSEHYTGKAFDVEKPAIANAYAKITGLREKPRTLLVELAIGMRLEKASALNLYNLLLMRSPTGLCLATVIDGERLAFMGSKVSEVCAIADMPGECFHSCWQPEKLY